MSPNSSRKALDTQVAAAEHIRDCDACRRMFEVAYEEMRRLGFANYSDMVVGPNPFELTVQILPELRSCPNWPKSI
jgi:predicted anti-sigma-YlaC factor YlaD